MKKISHVIHIIFQICTHFSSLTHLQNVENYILVFMRCIFKSSLSIFHTYSLTEEIEVYILVYKPN